MRQLTRFSLATAALVAALAAQTPTFIGFTYNVQVGASSRGSLGAAAGEVMTVIKGEEYAGWGAAVPGTRTINAVFCVVQDQDAVATPEVFDVKIYPEDPANPGLPQLSAGQTFATGVAGPPAPATGVVAAANRTIAPATAVTVPIQGSGDVFVSFVLPTAVVTPTFSDGLSIQVSLGYAPTATFTIFDAPGNAQSPQTPSTTSNTHGLTLVPPSALTLNRTRYQVIDVAHIGAGGVGLTITNQTSATGSNNPPPAGFGPAPGVAGFNSGVSPDVGNLAPTRDDDVSFDYFRGTPAAGNFVLFFADIGTFGPEIPLSLVFPGSTGTVCVTGNAISIGSTLADATGEAFNTLALPPLVPAIGTTLVQTALELDFLGGVFHISPCAKHTF
jgi:hypothetical protein